MSYILDALRKSEQQRQHANAPSLLHAPVPPEAPKPVRLLSGVVLAAALIGAGMLLGWLQPWRAEPPLQPSPVAARPPAAEAPQPPRPISLPMPPDAVAGAPSSLPPSTAAAVVRTPELVQPVTASAIVDVSPRVKADASNPQPAAPANHVMRQSELPSEVQQALPGILIAFHQYSGTPAERRVMINNSVLREGELIAPGLKLEQITPDGVVIGFQGYQFARGVR